MGCTGVSLCHGGELDCELEVICEDGPDDSGSEEFECDCGEVCRCCWEAKYGDNSCTSW